MNKFFKVAMICFGTNVLFMFLMFNSSSDNFIVVGLLWILYLVIQLIVGLVYSFGKENSEFGKGVLLGSAISMLIGFSVCSGVIG